MNSSDVANNLVKALLPNRNSNIVVNNMKLIKMIIRLSRSEAPESKTKKHPTGRGIVIEAFTTEKYELDGTRYSEVISKGLGSAIDTKIIERSAGKGFVGRFEMIKIKRPVEEVKDSNADEDELRGIELSEELADSGGYDDALLIVVELDYRYLNQYDNYKFIDLLVQNLNCKESCNNGDTSEYFYPNSKCLYNQCDYCKFKLKQLNALYDMLRYYPEGLENISEVYNDERVIGVIECNSGEIYVFIEDEVFDHDEYFGYILNELYDFDLNLIYKLNVNLNLVNLNKFSQFYLLSLLRAGPSNMYYLNKYSNFLMNLNYAKRLFYVLIYILIKINQCVLLYCKDDKFCKEYGDCYYNSNSLIYFNFCKIISFIYANIQVDLEVTEHFV